MRSEVVIAFVGAVGVDSASFRSMAQTRLKAYGYEASWLSVSGEIRELSEAGYLSSPLKETPEFDRIRTHMAAGDELRRLGRGLLGYSIARKIGQQRPVAELAPEKTLPMPGHAWLVSSLKNPKEAEVLRSVYREGFFLIGLYASEKERTEGLKTRGLNDKQAAELIRLDIEGDEKSGQQTRKTFELADAWVKTPKQLERVLDLIFGDAFGTPGDDENAMALAYSEALRSSDLSRQVGAAIISETGEVLAVGRNEVPAPGGGQYSPPSDRAPTARDCDLGVDFNQRERQAIQSELAGQIDSQIQAKLEGIDLKSDVLTSIQGIVLGVLNGSRLHDITEYGRAVHAEMSALVAAARIGVSVQGGTLYCTTFPCHNCAKHIAASGIKRVVFVEPYPKSKAKELHGDSIQLADEISSTEMSRMTAALSGSRTVFEPFVGVGPRRYFDLFSLRLGSGREMKRKDDDGKAVRFEPKGATPRVSLPPMTYLGRELDSADKLNDALEQLEARKS